MATCFVIQPFDGGKFDKRYRDVFEPAIRDAKLDAYRVDKDASAEVPIDSIEDGIKAAAICLADITLDNPNVWYELGYARAAKRPLVLVCSKERTTPFPFDIQHRSIIRYEFDSSSDFAVLRNGITERLLARLDNKEVLRQFVETEQVATVEGLTQPELAVIAAIGNEVTPGGAGAAVYSIKEDVERAGLNKLGFSIGLRRLQSKGLIALSEERNYNGDEYDGVNLTDYGWDFIDKNENLFIVRKPQTKKAKAADAFDDDLPF